MRRTKLKKNNALLSVTLEETEYSVLIIRRAVLEFVARHREGFEADLPLRPPELEAAGDKKRG